MLCPKCKCSTLVPMELEKGLVGAGCENCSGVLLSLINYRYWADNFSSEESEEVVEIEAEDSKAAKICPKCNKLMTKYRIGLESDNRVELCSHCDEAWLDGGEWQLLKKLDVEDKLPDIFTEAWQRNIRKQREKEKWNQHFEELIGTDDFVKVKEFKNWLDKHEKNSDIKHYISINFDK